MAHTSGTSSRRHDGSVSSRAYVETDWEAKEALRQRELEEARARAAQMEKTMRWWSDCTANWREKWSKVRNERNKAREEAKLLRSKLDSALKDANTYRREKVELEAHNEEMRKELERIHLLLLKHAGQWDQGLVEALEGGRPTKEEEDEEEVVGGGSLGDAQEAGEPPQPLAPWSPDAKLPPADDPEVLYQKLSMIQLRLDEATKTLHIEREEKLSLTRSLERTEAELGEAKGKCEELRASRQEAVRELLALQDQHEDTVALIRADLLDEASSREGMDRRLADLRAQMERLQAENACEWGKRERLETEKLALEREVKKLRAEVRDAQERLERRGRPPSGQDHDLRHLQQEVADKAKELSDLKHAYNKVKKAASDKSTELAHVTRRAEQYEAEVKRLRCRVEELKRELAVTEDEVDSASNNIRKLQRTNDELQEQVESLQVQVEHLHSRSDSAPPSLLTPQPNIIERSSDNDESMII